MTAQSPSAKIIQIKRADPPKDGKKEATIKTTTDEVFGVWPEKLGLFRPGRSYKIEYTERDYKNRKYRTITKCEPCGENDSAESVVASVVSKSESEADFVARVVAAGVASQQVEYNAGHIGRAMRLAQSVYREIMRQAQPNESEAP